MGRARRQPSAISAADFTTVFGARRGRAPGDELPDENTGQPDWKQAELDDERSEKLTADLATEPVSSAKHHWALADALKHLNQIDFTAPQSHFTQELLTQTAASLHDRVHHENSQAFIYDVQTFCEVGLGDDQLLTAIKEADTDMNRGRLLAHLTADGPVDIDEMTDQALLNYRDTTAAALSLALTDAWKTPAPDQGQPQPVHSVLGQAAYRQLQRDLGSRFKRPNLEEDMTTDMWMLALRNRNPQQGQPSFAECVAAELRNKHGL